MLNTDDFIKRLEILFDHYGVNASLFADRIGVQRSSISHLLSGRNKPSLDFVLKIMEEFPDLNLYWILSGKGNLLQAENKPQDPDLFSESASTLPAHAEEPEHSVPPSAQVESGASTMQAPVLDSIFKRKEVSIERIVIFYSDNSFDDFAPKKKNPNPKKD